jgi:hypothetical protein
VLREYERQWRYPNPLSNRVEIIQDLDPFVLNRVEIAGLTGHPVFITEVLEIPYDVPHACDVLIS